MSRPRTNTEFPSANHFYRITNFIFAAAILCVITYWVGYQRLRKLFVSSVLMKAVDYARHNLIFLYNVIKYRHGCKELIIFFLLRFIKYLSNAGNAKNIWFMKRMINIL